MAIFQITKGTTDLAPLTITDNCDIYWNEGGQTIDSGLDLSALATGIHLLEIAGAVSGNMGTPANPLRADIDAGTAPKIRSYAQGGWLYFYPGGVSGSATEIEMLGRQKLILSTGGVVVALEVGDGAYAYVPDTVAVTNLRIGGGTVDQLYSATANTNWFIDGGTLNTGRGFSGTASYIMGGAEVTVARADTSATLPTGGTIVVADGRLKWRGGAVTIVVGSRGMVDLSEVPRDASISITGTARALSRSLLSSKYATITLTEAEYVGTRASLFSAGGFGNPGAPG